MRNYRRILAYRWETQRAGAAPWPGGITELYHAVPLDRARAVLESGLKPRCDLPGFKDVDMMGAGQSGVYMGLDFAFKVGVSRILDPFRGQNSGFMMLGINPQTLSPEKVWACPASFCLFPNAELDLDFVDYDDEWQKWGRGFYNAATFPREVAASLPLARELIHDGAIGPEHFTHCVFVFKSQLAPFLALGADANKARIYETVWRECLRKRAMSPAQAWHALATNPAL